MCTLCNLKKTPYRPSRQKKNFKQEKQTDNPMPAFFALIKIDYNSHR